MIGLSEQEKLLARIGSTLNKRIEAVVIGGSALLFYKFAKTATKDIDLVLPSEKEQKALASALLSFGFRAAAYRKEGEPQVFTLGDYRVDLFAGRVFKLHLSPGIQERVKEKVVFGNLIAAVASPEDIILSKSITDRPGDRNDVAALLKAVNVEWDTILKECEWQAKHGDPRFPVFLYDFLDELVHQFGISVPDEAAKKIKKMYREFIESLERPKKMDQ